MNHALLDGLLEDFGTFDDTLEQLEMSGEIVTIAAGKWNNAQEAIVVGDKSHMFNVRYRFADPILSSIILRKTLTATHPEGRIDFNATIVSHRDLQVQVGDDWIDIGAFAAAAVRRASPNAHQTDDTILNILAQYGWNPTERFPMYLQHLGAGQDAFNQIASHFVSIGATDNTKDVRSRAQGQRSSVLAAYRHPGDVPVISMETSKANRSLSMTGSGFIGFLDGTWGTLTKVLVAHRTRQALQTILDNPNSTEAQRTQAAANQAHIRNIFTTPVLARAFRNWGGTTEVPDVLGENPSRYFAQQVPCGRFTIDGGTTYSVWTSRADGTATATLPAATLADALPALETGTF